MGLQGTISPMLVTFPSLLGLFSLITERSLQVYSTAKSLKSSLSIPMSLQGHTSMNNFTGTIPASLGNISKLEWLSLGENNLHGIIPDEIGNLNLQAISLNQNHLTGSIPLHFQYLLLNTNCLFIQFPFRNSSIKSWSLASKSSATFHRSKSASWKYPLYLSNCSQLTELILTSNQFTGPVPTSLGRLEHLQTLILAGNHLTGSVPKGIGSLRNLNLLYLADNNLIGSIPSTIKGMKSLQRLFLGGNQLEQIIPSEICLLSNLGEMDLGYNKLSGSIPNCIGNLRYLQSMILSSNSLSSPIPSSLWSLQNLLFLDLSFNSLSGSLHANMRALKMLQIIDLSWNIISGNIPTILGGFQSLYSLNLSGNSFWGPIPESLGELKTLDYMDLSHNLSGAIPKSLEALSHLQYLNLSFNNLSGEIPGGGPFANFTVTSVVGNEALCGLPIFQVPPCRSHDTQKSKTTFLLKVFFPSLHQCQSLLLSFSFGKLWFCVQRSTFDGTNVAVKVLNLQIEGAFKSFDAECEVLVRVRHRNLVKVISSCSNPELRALVLQYMPNGSLEKWLYSHNYCLNLFQRVSIMVDVALALEYLHHGQSEPVVHCDLKPSNVLLDGEMIAHVGDFGIAKILVENKTATQTKTLGTLGYIAPEYGSEGRVSTKGDIYSYGVMLLEMFTRKKPTDVMFVGELSLRQWVMTSIPDKIMEVIDANLLSIEDGRDVIAAQGDLLAIMELGLECSREFPEERVDIKEVVTFFGVIAGALQMGQTFFTSSHFFKQSAWNHFPDPYLQLLSD
ncbi:hypothetical protein AAG906_020189 [Vitis piasezkii]